MARIKFPTIKVSHTARRLILRTGIVCLLIVGVGAFVAPRFEVSAFSWLFGVAVGYAASVVRVIMLERSINKSADMDRKKASNYMQALYLVRFAVAFVALLVTALFPDTFSLIGAALALIAVQPAAYLTRFRDTDDFDKGILEHHDETP